MRIRVSLIRFLLEAGFIILAAVAAGLAQLSALWIGVVMFAAWLLVAFVETAEARGVRRRRAAPELAEPPEAEAAPAHVAVTEQEPKPEPEPEGEREQVLAAVPPPPEPEPVPELEPEPEPEPVVVSLALRDPTPRTWNLWELEELAARDGDPARVEELGLLLLHMRQFANAAGELPAEFDPLVREAFGADLAELVT